MALETNFSVNFKLVNPQLFQIPINQTKAVVKGGFYLCFETPLDLKIFQNQFCAKIFSETNYECQVVGTKFFAICKLDGDRDSQVSRVKQCLTQMRGVFNAGNFSQKLAEKNGHAIFFDE